MAAHFVCLYADQRIFPHPFNLPSQRGKTTQSVAVKCKIDGSATLSENLPGKLVRGAEPDRNSPPQWYICGMRAVIVVGLALLLASAASAQTTVSFPTEDGGVIYGNLYGKGDRGVVLAHGGKFNKESWSKQAQILESHGFRVLALDFRGYGKSRGPGDSDSLSAPLELDVLAAVRYLHEKGAKSVSVVGGSMGASAAGDASIASRPGEIDRLVLLGGAPDGSAEKLKSPTLFIVARDDASGDGPRLPRIQEQFSRAPEPKELIILDGSAHAQYLFETDQAERVMNEILRFLSERPKS